MATILTKKKDTTGAPSSGDLTNSSGGAELAVNTADKRLYTKDSGGSVVEVGINPTSITTGTLNTSGAVVFNDAGADVDFRVEGDTNANLLFVDAGNDRVGIGTSSPDCIFGIGDVQSGTRFFFDRALYADIFGGFNHLGDSGGFELYNINNSNDRSIRFSNGTSYAGRTERMRITSAGAIQPISVFSGGGFGTTESTNTFNDNNVNGIGQGNAGFVIVYISQGNGITAVPIFQNAGGGVAWSVNMFDPDAGTFVNGAGPSVSFATAGAGANSYTLALSGGTGALTIERTAGSAAYTVVVKLIGF